MRGGGGPLIGGKGPTGDNILSRTSSNGPSSASISSILRNLSKSFLRFLEGRSGENIGSGSIQGSAGMRVLVIPGAWLSESFGGLSFSFSPLELTEPHSISILGGLPILSTEK